MTKRELAQLEYKVATNVKLLATTASYNMLRAKILKDKPQTFIDGFWVGHKMAHNEFDRICEVNTLRQ